jgi:acetyl-CoA synthetase
MRQSRRRVSARFANVLKARDIGLGDVVAGMSPRISELMVAVLGTWRIGAVCQPLFTAFGPAAVESRVVDPGGSDAKLIVVDGANRGNRAARQRLLGGCRGGWDFDMDAGLGR